MGGGNERGNWAQLGEVVGGGGRKGGEAAERSHNVFLVLMRTPLGMQRRARRAGSPGIDTRTRARKRVFGRRASD